MTEERLFAAKNLLQPSFFPRLPEEIYLIRQEIEKKAPNSKIIAHLISRQPEMMIAFINSAKRMDHKNIIKPEHDVRAIIDLIGLKSVSQSFISGFLSRNLAYSEFDKRVISFGINTAMVAAKIAEHATLVHPTEAYLAGITHNIGIIFLAKNYPEYEEWFEKSLTYPVSHLQENLTHHNTTYLYASILISDFWGLERNIIKSMLMVYKNVDASKLDLEGKKFFVLSKIIEASRYIVTEYIAENHMTAELKENGSDAAQALGLDKSVFQSCTEILEKRGVNTSEIISQNIHIPEPTSTETFDVEDWSLPDNYSYDEWAKDNGLNKSFQGKK